MTDPAAATALALLIAAALGLRHALDPDHLVAVTGLAATRDGEPAARVARIGFAWGVGHATSLSLAGLALLRLGWNSELLPGGPLERCVGVAIVVIGLRLILLQRLTRAVAIDPPHEQRYHWAFGTGLIHGLAGSGAVTLALLPLVPCWAAVPALLLFAGMTCVSMTMVTLMLGTALSRPAWRARFGVRTRRALGIASVAFGVGYAVLA